MKKLILFFVVIFNCVFAQDTIRFRSGEVQAVKVSEVGVTEIKYNRFDNISGPQYVVEKNDIQLIKYSGGHVDSFNVVIPEVEKRTKPVKQTIVQNGDQKIIIKGHKLIFNSRGLGETRLGKLVNTCPDNAKRNAMMKPLIEMKRHRTRQYVFGFVGLGLAIAAPYIGLVSTFISYDETPLAVGAALGVTFGVTGAVISSIQKHKRNQKKIEVARIYNQ